MISCTEQELNNLRDLGDSVMWHKDVGFSLAVAPTSLDILICGVCRRKKGWAWLPSTLSRHKVFLELLLCIQVFQNCCFVSVFKAWMEFFLNAENYRVFIGRTDATSPILWPLHAKSWLIGKDWCWEGLGAGGEGDDRGWDGWMASLTWWTCVWVNSGNWWWTGRPGCSFRGCKELDTTEWLN